MNGKINARAVNGSGSIILPLDSPSNGLAKSLDGEVALTWVDPVDKYGVPQGVVGNDPYPIVAQWDHTTIVRKENSDPVDINDGTVVAESIVRNQYQTAAYSDKSVTNDIKYHYGLFAVTDHNIPSLPYIITAFPTAGTPIVEFAEGSLIKLYVNKTPIEFYIAKHDYEPGLNGSGRTLVIQKDCYDKQKWLAVGQLRYFNDSDLYDWLNGEYYNRFSDNMKTLIGNTTYYSYQGEGVKNTYKTWSSPIFSPSAYEMLGIIDDNVTPNEGTELPVSTTIRIAYWNGDNPEYTDELGQAVRYWTRSGSYTTLYDSATVVQHNGNWGTNRINWEHAVRPCFTLPGALRINSDLIPIEN